jgi:transcription initiation factor TFIIB
VVAETVDTGPEWRSFEKEERARSAPLKLVVKTDMAVRLGHGVQWLRLAKFHREMLHSFERRLAAIGAEIRRVKECAGLAQRVAEEAETLVKRYFDVVGSLPPEVVAVAVLWAAAKAAGMPRPMGDFLKCSKADERRVRKAAWRLKEVIRPGRPSIDDYVKMLAAKVGLPASAAKTALDILEKNRRLLVGRNPWIWAAAALWLASFKKRGLLKRLAEAAGSTPPSVRNAAERMRV